MSMRIGPKRVLSNSPLVLVLCQVRFSPLMAMEGYIPRIQEELRFAGYPINASSQLHEVVSAGTSRTSTQRTRWRWEFLDKDRRIGVVLHEGFVAVQTTDYQDFDQFSSRVLDVVDIVSRSVGELFVTRVGLRYVDVVLPRDGERWEQYLQPGLAGFAGKRFLPGTTLQLHQVIGPTEVGAMHVRLLQNRDGVLLPPDLADNQLELPAHLGTQRPGSLVTILDVDNFCDLPPAEYDRARVEKKGWELKNVAYATFVEEIATEHALAVWK
jgi:uncharacterized protein (TIGR04255 family)